ncbi:hypothetical protein BJ138DRAFT_997877 [Hygrophoropsis aurantiaca]|uniref:Uncharacterized protein n=1 Tax=Hygrophoropsis aurantiaca TaxID=72124 RepID=A0ACB8ARC5_9AGAM|nr:hypothetical protein BJ138DRAFT_997877 [Hygrophoropsis aurantiaca]
MFYKISVWKEDDTDSRIQQLVAEEIDFEIALRQRLAATIESRITWALLLEESLTKHVSEPSETYLTEDLEDVAMDALDAVESRSAFLTDQELSFATSEPPSRSFSPSTTPTPPIALRQHAPLSQHKLLPQTSARSHRYRAPPAARSTKRNIKLVYLQDTSVDPPVIAKMACPDCHRSDFTNLQGLLNHCRLRHQRDFGTHDECMQKCAVIVPEEEHSWVAEHGTELSGISLPSLRRLFELAVGANQNGNIPETALNTDSVGAELPPARPKNGHIPSTLLSRTLGLHVDTPALAPFLGKNARRRCINVWGDEGLDIDITTPHDNGSALKSGWRKSYLHRNIARPELDTISTSDEHGNYDHPTLPSALSNLSIPAGTRFHFATRVQISDRSLWLPPNRRQEPLTHHSHRWMISVTSPSYSLHITTFLAQMTVVCLTYPPPSTFIKPLTVDGPPFVAIGTTDQPFLARLTFTWAGKQNPPLDIDHWVELDPFKSGSSTLGEEQIIDVELDRNTELLPARPELKLPALEKEIVKSAKGDVENLTPDPRTAAYGSILKSLLPRIPLTMKGKIRHYKLYVKGRSAPQVPYKLVASPAHFFHLLPGRRKAIEVGPLLRMIRWGRARALQEAYEHRIKLSPSTDNIPLTTGDVYCWLEDEGHFLRPSPNAQATPKDIKDNKKSTPPRSAQDEFCSLCGMKRRYHPSFNIKNEGSSTGFICDIVQDHRARPPCLDMTRIFNGNLEDMIRHNPQDPFPSSDPSVSSKPLVSTRAGHLSRYSSRDMVSITPPAMTLAVRRHIHSLNLPSFTESSRGVTDIYLRPRSEVEDHLAPYALVSASLKGLIGILVRRGLDVAKQDLTKTLLEGRKKSKPYMLTPSHIIRGLHSGATTSPTQTAVLLSLARLAVPTSFGRQLPAEQAPSEELVVKSEPE